jgi:alanyl-tRNA synthetase
VHTELAHTAEHAFVGSLQKIIGVTLSVRKVEHRDKDSVVFIDANYLDIELIARAQSEVNLLIVNGRRVLTYTFSSLKNARERFPLIRANESRLKEDESIRVVEIEGHDVAACRREHAKDMNQCGLFLVTNVSKTNKEYEINFVVDKVARETALKLSLRLAKISSELGANVNTIESTIKKLKKKNEVYLKNLKFLTREKLHTLIPNTMIANNNQVSIVNGIFSGLLDNEISSYAAQKIKCKNTVVIIANKSDTCEQDIAKVVFARSSSLTIDCEKLFREVVPAARGGGRPEFFTGTINRSEVDNAITLITKVIFDYTVDSNHFIVK